MAFAMIPLNAIRDPRLTGADLRVLGLMSSAGAGSADGESWYSAEGLAAKLQITARTARTSRSRLRRLGYIVTRAQGRRVFVRVVFAEGDQNFLGSDDPRKNGRELGNFTTPNPEISRRPYKDDLDPRNRGDRAREKKRAIRLVESALNTAGVKQVTSWPSQWLRLLERDGRLRAFVAASEASHRQAGEAVAAYIKGKRRKHEPVIPKWALEVYEGALAVIDTAPRTIDTEALEAKQRRAGELYEQRKRSTLTPQQTDELRRLNGEIAAVARGHA